MKLTTYIAFMFLILCSSAISRRKVKFEKTEFYIDMPIDIHPGNQEIEFIGEKVRYYLIAPTGTHILSASAGKISKNKQEVEIIYAKKGDDITIQFDNGQQAQITIGNKNTNAEDHFDKNNHTEDVDDDEEEPIIPPQPKPDFDIKPHPKPHPPRPKPDFDINPKPAPSNKVHFPCFAGIPSHVPFIPNAQYEFSMNGHTIIRATKGRVVNGRVEVDKIQPGDTFNLFSQSNSCEIKIVGGNRRSRDTIDNEEPTPFINQNGIKKDTEVFPMPSPFEQNDSIKPSKPKINITFGNKNKNKRKARRYH